MKFVMGDRVKYQGATYVVMDRKTNVDDIEVYELTRGNVFTEQFPLTVPCGDVQLAADDDEE